MAICSAVGCSSRTGKRAPSKKAAGAPKPSERAKRNAKRKIEEVETEVVEVDKVKLYRIPKKNPKLAKLWVDMIR
jgi:hypothetical protein